MAHFKLSVHDRSTLEFRVTAKLRELILKGDFKMGERLMQEEWAEKLGVSRMPLREALRQLEVEGLVTIVPRKGAIVTPVLVDDIKEIYHLRAMLESEAVKQAAPFFTEEDIFQLEAMYDKMVLLNKDVEDLEEYIALNEQFHKLLIHHCPGKRIKGFIDTLWKGIPPTTPSLLADYYKESQQEHLDMVIFAKQKDSERLSRVMEKHIMRTGENLMAMMNKGIEP